MADVIVILHIELSGIGRMGEITHFSAYTDPGADCRVRHTPGRIRGIEIRCNIRHIADEHIVNIRYRQIPDRMYPVFFGLFLDADQLSAYADGLSVIKGQSFIALRFNELNDKKKSILNDFDKNIDEFNKINENKLNYANNELEGIEENKKKLVELSENLAGQNLKEIEGIKIQIKDLENQIKEENEKYLGEIKEIKENCDEQLKIIKDREDYITKQTDIVSNNLKSLANQNEKAVAALRQENQQLKTHNYTLSKKLS